MTSGLHGAVGLPDLYSIKRSAMGKHQTCTSRIARVSDLISPLKNAGFFWKQKGPALSQADSVQLCRQT
jgi:hypothetical protein